MGKAEPKTKPTRVTVTEYIAGLPDVRRRDEAKALDSIYQRITGQRPRCGVRASSAMAAMTTAMPLCETSRWRWRDRPRTTHRAQLGADGSIHWRTVGQV